MQKASEGNTATEFIWSKKFRILTRFLKFKLRNPLSYVCIFLLSMPSKNTFRLRFASGHDQGVCRATGTLPIALAEKSP